MSGTGGLGGLARRRREERERHREARPGVRAAVQWPMVLWLTLVWWVLWGSYSALSLVGGIVVSVVVLVAFPLPPLRMHVRVRPWPLLVLLGRFLLDVVVASVQVAVRVLRSPRDLRNALVRVPLSTESDIVLVAVAEMVSLVPGTVVVEVHRPTHTLYLHALDTATEESVAAVRENVLAQERRLLRAFGVDPAPTGPAAAEAPAGGGVS